jgi:hypothetical protein
MVSAICDQIGGATIVFALITAALFGALGSFILLGAHYWLPLVLKRDTEPPESYVWGVALGILTPFVAWLMFWWAFRTPTIHAGVAAVGFLAVVGMAGLGTISAYMLDRHYGRHLQGHLWRTRRQRLSELLTDTGADPAATLAAVRDLLDVAE